jgi:Mg2+/Co2+ transporter CorC
MQSSDNLGNIKQLTQIDLPNVADLAAKIKSAEEKGATSHTIAKLPKAGEKVEISGLSYRVEFADFVRGRYVVKLVCRDK